MKRKTLIAISCGLFFALGSLHALAQTQGEADFTALKKDALYSQLALGYLWDNDTDGMKRVFEKIVAKEVKVQVLMNAISNNRNGDAEFRVKRLRFLEELIDQLPGEQVVRPGVFPLHQPLSKQEPQPYVTPRIIDVEEEEEPLSPAPDAAKKSDAAPDRDASGKCDEEKEK